MYEVWVHTPDYEERTAIICEAGGDRTGRVFSKLIIPRKENQVTEAVLIMPYQPGIVELFPLDTRLEFYDDGRLELETQWFVRVPPKLTYELATGDVLVEVRAECALYLLAGRIVAYAAGAPQTTKSGPADDLIKAIVRENLGDLASADRDLSAYLDVAADAGAGATVYKTITRQNVLLVCQKIARASAQAGVPVFFDVVWTGSKLELRTYVGQRGITRSAVLAASFGTLVEASRSFDHREEATVIYCAGQGQGEQRLIVSVSDDARRTETPFNRREVFVDARYLSLADSVATEADATLWRRRPIQELGGVAVDTQSCVYGYSWRWGDQVLSDDQGASFPVRVYGVEIQVTPGLRRIVVELRADSAESDDAVRRIEGQLDQGASDELPIFSVDPLVDGVPQAGADGTIADGWLPDTIARITNLSTSGPAGGDLDGNYPAPTVVALQGVPVESNAPNDGEVLVGHEGAWAVADIQDIKGVATTPAPNSVPLADVDGKLADGWLRDTIARTSDLTWASIDNKPATFASDWTLVASKPTIFPPTAHTHVWSEVTGKPTAFASDWTLVANKPATFAPAAHTHLWADLTDKPTTFAPAAHTHPWSEVTGKPMVFASDWTLVANKPATFAPATHTHLWADFTDKPATFAPSGHAASHRHGGSDEIATATPAANAIPKANAAGWLDAWLSAAIARVAGTMTAGRIAVFSNGSTVDDDANLSWDAAQQAVKIAAKDNGTGMYVPFLFQDSGGVARGVFGISSGSPPDALFSMPGGKALRVIWAGNVANEVARFTNTALLIGTTTDNGQKLQINSGAGVAIRIDGSGAVATTAGAASGKYLILNYAGTQYKIALLNN